MNKRLLITVGVALFLLAGTLLAIRFAQGYRFSMKEKKVSGTGLLVVNSFPKGASVFINDKLTTATDDTLNLPPGDYQIKIVKDGFISWEKKIKLEKELVSQTNAHLFPAVPDLKGLTFAGALNLTPSPDGQKIAFSVASASARLKNGLWVLDLTSSPFSSQQARQISQSSGIFDFTKAQLVWSPDSKSLLVKKETDTLLLEADHLNETQSFKDVTARLPLILTEWEEEMALKRERQWQKLPEAMQKIASESAKNIYFSPDEEKVIYTATKSVVIPEELIPPLPARNSQPETRHLEADKIYVYDLKEDRNFYISDAEAVKDASEADELEKRMTALQNQYSPLRGQKYQWFPTSQHLIFTNAEKIVILEYDNTNQATVYAGPFAESFSYPWPDASRLLILTTLNPDASLPLNLYAVELK
jgi:hypothetical protein